MDVQKYFLKSFFNGKLPKIARIIEETLGKGSFRVLGIMGADDETPIQVMEILRDMKNRQKK